MTFSDGTSDPERTRLYRRVCEGVATRDDVRRLWRFIGQDRESTWSGDRFATTLAIGALVDYERRQGFHVPLVRRILARLLSRRGPVLAPWGAAVVAVRLRSPNLETQE